LVEPAVERNPLFRINFLIVGAQKSGTTALASFLSAHPEVCMSPKKENHFFDSEAYARCADPAAVATSYCKFFPNYAGHEHVGEATPRYMFLPGIAEKVRRYNPDMKLIFVLRNPVERAISHYAMELGRGRETLSLPLALLAEPWRLRGTHNDSIPSFSLRTHSYVSRGFYFRQIERFRQRFPASQIHVLTTEDLWNRHDESLKDIYRFLGIKNLEFLPPQKRVFSGDTRPVVPPGLRLFLRLFFRREVGRLEAMLGRDLSAWK
jgi:hypothetical protein